MVKGMRKITVLLVYWMLPLILTDNTAQPTTQYRPSPQPTERTLTKEISYILYIFLIYIYLFLYLFKKLGSPVTGTLISLWELRRGEYLYPRLGVCMLLLHFWRTIMILLDFNMWTLVTCDIQMKIENLFFSLYYEQTLELFFTKCFLSQLIYSWEKLGWCHRVGGWCLWRGLCA